MKHNSIVALDIGATSSRAIRFALNGRTWEKAAEIQCLTPATKGVEYVLCTIKDLVQSALGEHHCDAIGVAIPGLIDYSQGTVIRANRLAGFTNIPVAELLQHEFSVPVFVGNDGDLATLGEARFGAGKDRPYFMRIGVGSGIAFGLVQHGELVYSEVSSATEIGCMQVTGCSVLPCTHCRSYHCLRMIAPGNAIQEAVRHRIQTESTDLRHLNPDEINALSAITIFRQRTESIVCNEAIQASIQALSEAIVTLGNRHCIDFCVIGGGLAGAGDAFIGPIDAYAHKMGICVTTSLINGHSGLYGALAYTLRRLGLVLAG